MPRVHTAKASRDYPAHDIKKGDTYYHWAFFRGPKQMSKTPPRRSQTTGAPALSAAYAAEEQLEAGLAAATCPQDVVDALDEAVSAADESIEQYDEKISNLEGAFQSGCPALDEAQEQRDAVESWKDELESASVEVAGIDDFDGWDGLTPERQEEVLTEAREIAEALSLDL